MAHRLHLPFRFFYLEFGVISMVIYKLRVYLSCRIELYTPQTYALQMVIKQQKNRDAFLVSLNELLSSHYRIDYYNMATVVSAHDQRSTETRFREDGIGQYCIV